MGEDHRNLFSRLDQISKTEVSNVFHGIGEIGNNIPILCNTINSAISSFFDIPTAVDLSDALTITFLKSSLPTLVEILFRRTTLR